MTRFLIRLGINAVAMYAAIRLVPGIQMQTTSWVAIVVLALIFGLVNTLIAPVLKLLTCPFILITLGLFTLLINTFLFWLTGGIGGWFGLGFSAGFVAAFLGALVVTIVNVVLSAIFKEELNKGH
jgi:putative membrane protein